MICVFCMKNIFFYFYPQGDQLRDLTTKSLVNSATMELMRIISEASKTLSNNIEGTHLSHFNCNIAVVFMNLLYLLFTCQKWANECAQASDSWNTRHLIIHSSTRLMRRSSILFQELSSLTLLFSLKKISILFLLARIIPLNFERKWGFR